MGVLDGQYYGHFWTNNAGMMGGYEGIVFGDPRHARHTATTGASDRQPCGSGRPGRRDQPGGGERCGQRRDVAEPERRQPGVERRAAGRPGGGRARKLDGADADADDEPTRSTPQMAAQPLQMLGQFPQMLGQMPQMAMGMLGPLTQGMGEGGLGGAGIDKVGQFDQTTLAATTDAAARGGGGGGAGGLGGGAGVMSSFTRPTGSFNAPGAPKLPTGWTPGAAVPEVATSAGPATGGGTRRPVRRAGCCGRCRPHGDAMNAAGTAPPRAGPCS